MTNLKLGLCKGRHSISEVADYIFETELNPTNVTEINELAYERLHALFPQTSIIGCTFAYGVDGTKVYRGDLTLYVTGLTVALVSVINNCKDLGINLVLMHFNRDTNDYFEQRVY